MDVNQIRLEIVPEYARDLAEAGIELKALLADHVFVQHPEIAALNEIAYVMFRAQDPDGVLGRFKRSS